MMNRKPARIGWPLVLLIWPLFCWADSADQPVSLGATELEVGIIAGHDSINLILSTLIPGDDDGKVSLENARLEGMADFITVPVSHPFLMKDDDVIRQTIHFLQQGAFQREPE